MPKSTIRAVKVDKTFHLVGLNGHILENHAHVALLKPWLTNAPVQRHHEFVDDDSYSGPAPYRVRAAQPDVSYNNLSSYLGMERHSTMSIR